MKALEIPKTKFTLAVDFDPAEGNFAMKGSSYPENALEFFQPIFAWLERYIAEIDRPITLRLELEYLNTSSSKCILDFFKILEAYHQEGGKVRVLWFYEANDEDMLETGEEFLEDLDFPFELKPYSTEET